MANVDNLIPQAHKLSVEEQSKGGKASGKARREKADFIKTAKAILNCALSEYNQEIIKKKYAELEEDEINYRTLILLKQLEKAINGDINSAKLLIDTTGEKPKEEVSAEVKMPVFNIQVTDNKDLEKEFSKYETNTETN